MILARQLDAFSELTEPVTKIALPHDATNATSREAARLIAGCVNANQRNILRLLIVSKDGITRKDVERGCGMKTPTACARLNALEHARKIQKHHVVAYERDGSPYDKLVTREKCSVYVRGPRLTEADWK